jgi:hypothetical protein
VPCVIRLYSCVDSWTSPVLLVSGLCQDNRSSTTASAKGTEDEDGCLPSCCSVNLIALMMEAANTSETSVDLCQTTRRINPKDSHLHTRRHESLKCHTVLKFIKAVVVQVVKLLHTPYGSRRSIIRFTKAHHWTESWTTLCHSGFLHPVFLRSFWILSLYLRLSPKWSFLFCFASAVFTHALYMPLPPWFDKLFLLKLCCTWGDKKG